MLNVTRSSMRAQHGGMINFLRSISIACLGFQLWGLWVEVEVIPCFQTISPMVFLKVLDQLIEP